ncbi:protein kinase [Pelomyxa schiedti]|nr:protein kinase [Pelomyxa schiedti]
MRSSGRRRCPGLIDLLCHMCGVFMWLIQLSHTEMVYDSYVLTNVSWFGGTPLCDTCDPGLNMTAYFACNYNNRGDWEDIKYFWDPTPQGATVTAVGLALMGAYNCDQFSDPGQVYIEVQGYRVGDLDLPQVTSCLCGNCVAPLLMYCEMGGGWPSYNYSGTNSVEVIVTLNEICLSYIEVGLNYTVNLPDVSSIQPYCGPTTVPTEVIIRGQDFTNSTALSCVFGETIVNTTWVSSEIMICQSPVPVEAGFVYFHLSDNRFTFLIEPEEPITFQYYDDVQITSVYPTEDYLVGGTEISVYGINIIDTEPFMICRFDDNTTIINASAIYSNGHIMCTTPPWAAPTVVALSVSLNGQYFSASFPFKFVEEPFHLTESEWIAIAVGGFAVVLILCLVCLWSCHKKNMKGEELIRAGNQEIDIKDVKLGERIGRGRFGEVYKATWKGATIAVKKLPTQQNPSNVFIREFQKEVILMKTLRHPNVVQFLGSCMSQPDICIATEYMCRGSLYGILHSPSVHINWKLTLDMLADAARGCLYLHSCKPPIVHRDLKSHNLLVDEFWKVKVCDFGLSTIVEQASQTMTACGTPCWTAPEVLRHSHYTEKADIYSFAVVMWECFTRQDPFAGMPAFRVIFCVGHEGLRPTFPASCPECYTNLVRTCWDEQPTSRPPFSDILVHIEGLHKFLDHLPKEEVPLKLVAPVIPNSPSPTNNSNTPQSPPLHVHHSHGSPGATLTTLTGSISSCSSQHSSSSSPSPPASPHQAETTPLVPNKS